MKFTYVYSSRIIRGFNTDIFLISNMTSSFSKWIYVFIHFLHCLKWFDEFVDSQRYPLLHVMFCFKHSSGVCKPPTYDLSFLGNINIWLILFFIDVTYHQKLFILNCIVVHEFRKYKKQKESYKENTVKSGIAIFRK